jgi:hypothetical protein
LVAVNAVDVALSPAIAGDRMKRFFALAAMIPGSFRDAAALLAGK